MRYLLLALSGTALFAQTADKVFTETIRPVLVENCAGCHKPEAVKGAAPFLRAVNVAQVDQNRGLWHNVSTQLRNRTMPPGDAKITEEDRLRIASWIDNRLRETACNAGDYAGPAVTRRLNRREYRNTIRDLFGIDFDVVAILPADGTGGSGFDTNGETLYVPDVQLEKYMEAAQQIVDRVVFTPAFSRAFTRAELPAKVPVYATSPYDVIINLPSPPTDPKITLSVDGAEVGTFTSQRRRTGTPAQMANMNMRMTVNLARGTHELTIAGEKADTVARIQVQQRPEPASPEKKAVHYRLFGMDPGERPIEPRKAARQILNEFLPKAFRRPIQPAEADRFMTMYDRAAERGDPYEERVKLALKAVLVWPEFLFRIEQKPSQPGIYPVSQHELATRLSYFLWSTAPDEQLVRLADQGKLQDSKVLTAQVDRMLDDGRSRAFTSAFMGQWLGTQDLGGRVVPLLTELQSYYTPETAADLRAQPILLMDYLLSENRSLLELLTADYTHMTKRLAKFYQLEDRYENLSDEEFKLVKWPDSRRAGILELGGVLALTSRYQESSPVLRGAWVLDTLFGDPVPPPPADVPPLEEIEKGSKLTMRERLEVHRSNQACAACHKLMDPIGLGLENFDWMGRWRESEAGGELPSGEKFNGPVELRQALLNRKGAFVNNVATRVLGYALGRSLRDGDSCTVQKIVQSLEKDNYSARTLIREIVLSAPFRNSQGGPDHAEPVVVSQRKMDVSKINALKQDAASHNNGVKPAPKKQ
jgi:mono/diheme cytochrome c family protein